VVRVKDRSDVNVEIEGFSQNMRRIKNRLLAKILTPFPSLVERLVGMVPAIDTGFDTIPWTPFTKGLKSSTFAIVTTAGVHLKGQAPFNMEDPDGDPAWRELPNDTPGDKLMITHDYYDHKDADRDINIVYPIDRMKELAERGVIGGLAKTHYGFMGHIMGRHIPALQNVMAPEVAGRLKGEGVDAVLLTPG
jgi:D-proline reductase (dithiol) PrdB